MPSSSPRSALRATAIAVIATFVFLAGTAPAFAHTELTSSDPADGATVATAPARVTLTFNEPVTPDFSTVTVIGPDRAAYQTGPTTTDGSAVSSAVQPFRTAGRYQIGYRVVSDDGHPVTGSLAFTVTTVSPASTTPAAPPTGSTAPTTAASPADSAAAPTGGGGIPVWPWILGAIVLIGGGVTWGLRKARR